MPQELSSPAPRLQAIADQLFFIVGCGRSGTSLLQAMISSHPDAIIPTETKFYTVIQPRYRALGDADLGSAIDRAIDAVLDCWQIRDLELDPAAVRAVCATGPKTWDTIFLSLLALYAEKNGSRRIGEKSPGHLRFLGMLSRRFPRARFIHMTRDPRAVVLSQIKAPFGTRRIAPNIGKWRRAVDIHREYADVLTSQRYMLVRYEDLVRTPEKTLRRVCGFLDLLFVAAMLDHHKRPVRGFSDRQFEHMANTLSPVFTSSIDKWRTELTPRQIGLIEYALADRMKLMGYEPSSASTKLPAVGLAVSTALYLVERGLAGLRGDRHAGATEASSSMGSSS